MVASNQLPLTGRPDLTRRVGAKITLGWVYICRRSQMIEAGRCILYSRWMHRASTRIVGLAVRCDVAARRAGEPAARCVTRPRF